MNRERRYYFYNFFANLLPGDGHFVSSLRCRMLRWCGCRVGRNVRISQYVHFYGAGDIEIGDDCWIASEVYMSALGGGRIVLGKGAEIMYKSLVSTGINATVSIGSYTRVAHCVSVKTSYHDFDLTGLCIAGECRYKDIFIGNGCWVCAGAIITPGVHIGDKCVVAAGAVVLEHTTTENGVLLAGVPASVKKHYF